jgi:hypothetical protein
MRYCLPLFATLAAFGNIATPAAEVRPLEESCLERNANNHCNLYAASINQLIATPERYDGRRVQILGYIHLEFEGDAIYPHRDDLEYGLTYNGLWVTFSSRLSHLDCTDAYVVVEGTFTPHKRGHMGSWSGQIDGITRCEKLQPAFPL